MLALALCAVSVPASADSASPTSTALVVPIAAGDSAAWSLIPADNANGAGRGNFGYAVDPGAQISDAVIVANTGSTPLELVLYAADAFTTPEGVLDLRLGDEPKADSGSWIVLPQPSLSLQPGEAREVPFTISVPADARPGDHPGGIVTSVASADPGATLAVDRRLGIRVHLRVSGELSPAVTVTEPAAAFEPSWNPFSGGSLTVSYTLTNTGDTRITATDAVALAGPLGVGAVGAPPTATAEVLPGSSIVVQRTLDDVASLGWLGGTLTVVPEAVGLGAQPLDAVSVDVSVAAVSWSLLAAVVVLAVAALVTVLLVLRRRSRRGADSLSEATHAADPV